MKRAIRHLIKRKELTLTDEIGEIWDKLSLLEHEGQPVVDLIFETQADLLNLKTARLNEGNKHYYAYLNFIVNQLSDYGTYFNNMVEAHSAYRQQMTQMKDEIREGTTLKEFVAKGRNSL